MRFIIHQLPYERTIVAGELRFERDGEPTGAVEQYRLTAAVDGYRFLRVDLDARQASSGRSTLYHLTLNPDGQPEQLKLRFWGDGLEVAATATWDGGMITESRHVNGHSYEDQHTADPMWFPSAAGLALLRPLVTTLKSWPAVTLNQTADPSQAMALQPTMVTVCEIEAATVAVIGQTYAGQGFEVTWADQQRRVWLHEDGWPLCVWRDDGLTATASQLVIYQ